MINYFKKKSIVKNQLFIENPGIQFPTNPNYWIYRTNLGAATKLLVCLYFIKFKKNEARDSDLNRLENLQDFMAKNLDKIITNLLSP